jgi:hypothetical protein
MACFPVIAEQLADAEAALDVGLPDVWKDRLLDPRFRRVLSDPKVQYLRPGDSMQDFVALTRRLRELHPEFPRDGVVMFCGLEADGSFNLRFGYPRFCLPDQRDPTRLSDVLYSWCIERRRKTRDCSCDEWIDGALHLVDEAVLTELGLEKPRDPEARSLVQSSSCSDEVHRLLELRADAAASALAALADRWVRCAEMNVHGKFVALCDLGQIPDSSARAIALAPGVYALSLRFGLSRVGPWPIIAALRLSRGEPDDRRCAFDLDIDGGAVALFDRQPLLRQVSSELREALSLDLEALQVTPSQLLVGKSAEGLLVPAGDGDGTYPVFRLFRGAEVVGLEVLFEAHDLPR